MIILCKKRVTVDDIGRTALFAVHPSDSDKLHKVPELKQRVFVEKKGRNAKHHSLVFALARLTQEHLDNDHPLKHSSLYVIVKAIMFDIGLTDEIPDIKTGEIRRVVKSIAFENMSEDEFIPVSDAMFKSCADVTGINESDLRREYKRFL